MLLIESTSELAKLSEEEIKTRSRIKNFVIDSRQVKKNSVFIALKGNNLDGNDFVYDALEKGACRRVRADVQTLWSGVHLAGKQLSAQHPAIQVRAE